MTADVGERNRMPKNLTAGTLKGATWVLTGNVATLGLRVVFLALLARLLSPRDFGLAAIGTSIGTFANLFTDAGISNTLVQRETIQERHISTAYTYCFLSGLTFLALSVALSTPLQRLFAMPGLAPVISVMGISFVLQALCVVPRALLKRAMKSRTLAMIDFVAFNLGYGLTACVMGWLHFGVWALVAAVTANNALLAVLYFTKAPHDVRFRFDRAALRDISRTSAGFSLAAGANLLALQGDNLIVGQVSGATALGFYSRAYQLMTIPANALGQITSYVVFPALARIQQDLQRLSRAFLRGTTITALVGLPASLLVPLYSHDIVYLLFGTKWLPITPVLTVLGIGTYFRLGYKLPGSVLQACGAIRAYAAVQAIYAACVILGTLCMARYGLNAVALAVLGSLIVVYLLSNILAIRALRLNLSTVVRSLRTPVLLATALGAVNYLLVYYTRPLGSEWLTVFGGAVASGAVLAVAWSFPVCRKAILVS